MLPNNALHPIAAKARRRLNASVSELEHDEHHILAWLRTPDVGDTELLVQRRCCTGSGSDQETKDATGFVDVVAARPRSRCNPVSSALRITSEGPVTR